MPTYDERDNAIMASNVFHQLCDKDREDSRIGKEPKWLDIVKLANEVRAFDNRIDVAYLAEYNLLDEMGFIERDLHNTNVRLNKKGRDNCAKGIDIPPSDIQKLQKKIDSEPNV